MSRTHESRPTDRDMRSWCAMPTCAIYLSVDNPPSIDLSRYIRFLASIRRLGRTPARSGTHTVMSDASQSAPKLNRLTAHLTSTTTYQHQQEPGAGRVVAFASS